MQGGMDHALPKDAAKTSPAHRGLNASGRLAGFALLLLVAAQFAVIVNRAVLANTNPWLEESVVYFHALVITCSVGWTLLANRHVRIDALQPVFREGFKVVIERLGLVATIGACLTIMVLSWGFVSTSWQVLEGSREVGGLPGIFLLKTLVPLLALLLALAALQRLRNFG